MIPQGGFNLCFGIGSKPRQRSVSPQLGHLFVELVSQDHSEGHALVRLVGGVSEHQTLPEEQSANLI